MKLFRDRDADGVGQGLFGRSSSAAQGAPDGEPCGPAGGRAEPDEGRTRSRGVSPAEDRIRAYTRDRAEREKRSRPVLPDGPMGGPAAEEGAHDPDERPVASGGELRQPSRPRRIWDIEADAAPLSAPPSPAPPAWPQPSYGEQAYRVPAAAPRPREAERAQAEDDEMIAYARAQVARMSESGLAHAGGGDAGGGNAGGGHASRAKTRMIGFQSREFAGHDPFSQQSGAARRGPSFPVGWLVVTDGPGHGASFALTAGVATLGRGEDQTVCLDFGDTAISRSAHASIAYDPETNQFFLGAGGRSNLVRLDERPVLATETLSDRQTIRIGETSLMFFALCGPSFSWQAPGGGRAGVDPGEGA